MLYRSSFLLLVACALHLVIALKANSWQARLDKSLLSVDLGVGSRLRLLNKAVKDPALQSDVRAAIDVIRERGFGKGHPEAIDLLWPTGTTARADLEGLTALRKQIPEVLEQLREQPAVSPFAAGGAQSPSLPEPTEVFASVVTLATDRAKQKELTEEAKDLLRSTPKGLETPGYKVVRSLDGPLSLGKPEVVELREYESFMVARTNMSGSPFGGNGGATGFNTLASYLFGDNAQKRAMAMTMPVEVTSSSSAGSVATGSMAFVLPKSDADAPPTPLDGSGVAVDQVPSRLVAAKAFAGIVTDAEVARQQTALLDALAAAGVSPVDATQITVLQYNSPLTVPWRRRNEVAIVVIDDTGVVDEVDAADEVDADKVDAADDAGDAAAVTSWYDSGVRM